MVALSKLQMNDLSRQHRFEVDLTNQGELTPSHTVAQAIDLYRDRMKIADRDVLWKAFSRGVTLDNKQRLSEVPETDSEWTVMPEVSAGT